MKHRFPRLRSDRLSTPAALAVSAAIMLVPANVLPVIATVNSGESRSDTIFSGVIELWRQGLWGIAAIVFTASIVIPAVKLAGLAGLLIAARRGDRRHARQWTRIHEALDFIGRWSMLDVFLVAFLSGLVQFGLLANVEPRAGIVAFGLAVILTVLATQAFDPRLLWRNPAAAAPGSPQ